MFSSRTILLGIVSIMVASCASTPKQNACDSLESPAITYRPPLDSVLAVTSHLKSSVDVHFSGVSTPLTEYRPYAKLWIEVSGDGTPIDVRMPVQDGYESTGNRAVDRAIFRWAREIRFKPDHCKSQHVRIATVSVDLPR
jgi:hypothetical protein